MKNKELEKYIPVYPKGCSLELLAVKAGYVKRPYSKHQMMKGILRLQKDLAWVTFSNRGVVERLLPIQQSTRKALAALNVPDPDGEETIYVSKGKEI